MSDLIQTAPPVVRLPWQGPGRLAPRIEEVLIVCFYDPNGISTVPETVAFMQSASQFQVTVLNLFEHKVDTGYLKLHPSIDLARYSALVIHNTVSYNVDNLTSLDSLLEKKLKDYQGVKVLMRQDENYRFAEVAQFVGKTGFDVILTCLPPEAVPLVYPPEVVGSPVFGRMLTGYVTPTLRSRDPIGKPRPIDIGYRGSVQPLVFGWLAYEKRLIGEEVSAALQGRGLVLDISSRWEDRFGGDAWLDFLSRCKATLGAESGASIFDLAGDLDARCAALEIQHASIEEERARTEAILRGLADLEGNVHYNQVSPRHFEAAACGTLQLLYPGDYSGIFVAGRHYFALNRDNSNLDEAVRLIQDSPRREAMIAAAFHEVVLDPANWIETFVAQVDAQIDRAMTRKSSHSPVLMDAPAGFHVLQLASKPPPERPQQGSPHEAEISPPRDSGMVVHQLSMSSLQAHESRHGTLAGGGLWIELLRQDWDRNTDANWLAMAPDSPAGIAGIHALLDARRLLALQEPEFARALGAPPLNARNVQFRRRLQVMLDSAATLVHAATAIRGMHAVAAMGIDTLPAAVVVKALFGIPVHFEPDLHVVESEPACLSYERQFWTAMEARLMPHVDSVGRFEGLLRDTTIVRHAGAGTFRCYAAVLLPPAPRSGVVERVEPDQNQAVSSFRHRLERRLARCVPRSLRSPLINLLKRFISALDARG